MINKKIIYTLIILIIIVSIALFVLLKYTLKNESEIKNEIVTHYDEEKESNYYELKKSSSVLDYEYVKKYLMKFWNYCLIEDETAIESLCKNYKKQFPKSIDNFSIDELYYTNELSTSFIEVTINKEKYYYTLLVRTEGFEIIESDENEYRINTEKYNGKYNDYEIKQNKYNQTLILSDDEEAKFYLNIFKKDIENDNIAKAYGELDEAYSSKRFGNFENFEKYAIDNEEMIKELEITDLRVSTNQDFSKTFYFEDYYNNPYKIEKNVDNSFKVQLDDYTIESEGYIDSYSKLSFRDKGITNCNKFFKMLNSKDYTAAYNVLDKGFKESYFRTQEEFETYIKNKLFNYNFVNYLEYDSKITNIHAYNTLVTDVTGENKNTVEFNIVMKLLEGTDFVMSFEVN